MTLTSLIFAAESTITANADATGLAREQFWGTMVGLLIFLAVSLGLITWFLRDQQKSITSLFAKSIDANAKLADAIDKLEDETRTSNQKLQEYLDRNLDKVASAIREIDQRIEMLENKQYQ